MNAAPVIHVTVGTAGHIDHGKTALVKLLTGCDTDRLPEEKARGMTIDLGFATCALPDGRRVGIVDVPGHERFIHNMVAGVTGIDVVLLVVAADDGVMPQTIEHFHIVRLLGVQRGLVAITKSDLVEPARLGEVEQQVRDLAAGSFLENAPMLPVSSKTGAGFDAFYDAFASVVAATAERRAEGPFRMNIERAFVLKGHGVIVSGIPRSGGVRVGDTLELLPGGGLKKIRSLQVYGADADEARAGECVALRLSDLDREEAGRGRVLAAPDYFRPARFFNARFQHLPNAGAALKPRTAIRFHVGTSDVPGHLLLPSLASLPPGAESYVQIQLAEPVIAAPGDPFVARALSPARTLGGGYIVGADEQRIRRSRGDWIGAREEEDQSFRDPAAALLHALRSAGTTPLKTAEAAHRALVSEDAARTDLARLVQDGRAVQVGDRYAAADVLEKLGQDLAAALSRLHQAQPKSAGFTRAELLRLVTADPALADLALKNLADAGRIELQHLPERILSSRI
ncbi:MAG: selenocysteine-specific translation elongation factor, partial [Verrucomicrobia bacterium]|nr:selenocysteine-specific translation elongation factor [Verrucomicrobiota bacterium]